MSELHRSVSDPYNKYVYCALLKITLNVQVLVCCKNIPTQLITDLHRICALHSVQKQ